MVFNDAGQILLVEHVFRPHCPWGLPGGWIERGENPAETVRRELEEELQLPVEVKRLLLCEPQGQAPGDQTPPGLGIAFYCRLANNEGELNHIAPPLAAYEVLSIEWVAPAEIGWSLTPLDQKAIVLATEVFEREQL